MSATNSDPVPMEGGAAAEDEKGGCTDVSSAVPPAGLPALPPPLNTISNFTGETEIGNRALSMASNDCSASLSSPTEASPAKPAVASPKTCKGTETNPPTSHIASASDSLKSTWTSRIHIVDSTPLQSTELCDTFGSPNQEKDFPPVLTVKGVTVTLENDSLWKEFSACGNEMVISKPGRRMFPYCRFRVRGLDPDRWYSLVLCLAPSDKYRYHWNNSQWEKIGVSRNQTQGKIQAFVHHYSTCKGSNWMCTLVSFHKLKMTTSTQGQDEHISLHTMHRYIPRLHLIPLPDEVEFTSDQPVVTCPDSIIFSFPQTEFMAVTTYQNPRITQLKINHNPFAVGFREDVQSCQKHKVTTDAPAEVRVDLQANTSAQNDSKEDIVNPSTTDPVVSAPVSNVKETRLVLKPIMSRPSGKDHPYVTCIRGNHALGELVLVDKPSPVEPKEKSTEVSVTPEMELQSQATSRSTPVSSPRVYRKRKTTKRRTHSLGSGWKPPTRASFPPPATCSPSLTVALQPELDDVEGMLFVSFTSKEALKVHTLNRPASCSAPEYPVPPTTVIQIKQEEERMPETDEEKISCMEAALLRDLRVLKHRQVIHPVLQEVGMKLSSLDSVKCVDLQYLGVHLPIPPANQPDKATCTVPALADSGLPFISRTGKTSDMTKIKGWQNKLPRNKEPSFNNDGLQKNLSAFCSDMLDEYLESEARRISERAAAFCTEPEDSVAYQLPAKGSSYVKTLDSALKHRNSSSARPGPQSCYTDVSPAISAPPTITERMNAASGSCDTSIGSSRSPTQQNQGAEEVFRLQASAKYEHKLAHMEVCALKEGRTRTHLTHNRLNVSLSVLLTKQMDKPGAKMASYQVSKSTPCGQEFCILGCVCSSLQQKNRGPSHCGRAECMFGCTCSKHKTNKHLSPGEMERLNQPVLSMANGDHVVQPHPCFHTNKLWRMDLREEDSEPLSIPPTRQHSVSAKHHNETMREEDKGPVYKYLESLMTCARVRAYNSAPPLQLGIPTVSTAEPQENPTVSPTNTKQTKTVTKADDQISHTSRNKTFEKKEIQIQSSCEWRRDHKMVLEALWRYLNQNQLDECFQVGPYLISPVGKIFPQKPSDSHVTYRVRISKASDTSDNKDKGDNVEEENQDGKSKDMETGPNEEDGFAEAVEKWIQMMPSLRGVVPAGHLMASLKPIGSPPSSLIEVNGKSYYQVRLLLGRLGSLHPANRLAAHVTGRQCIPSENIRKKPASTPKSNTTVSEEAQPTNTAVPQVSTANKTNEPKTTTTPPLGPFHPASWSKGSNTFPAILKNPPGFNPLHEFISCQLRSGSVPQNHSTSSSVSLSVSPLLKTPSFLTESGTYSFRICPPDSEGRGNQNQAGVSLPGGFTLIDLSNQTKPQETEKASNVSALQKLLTQRDPPDNVRHITDGFDPNWLGLNISSKRGSTESGSLSKPVSAESVGVNDGRVETIASESSDDSDYCRDEDDLDIVIVDIDEEGKILTEMKDAAQNVSYESSAAKRYFVTGWGTNDKDFQDHQKRRTHSVQEKRRRSEQRDLFDRLQLVLGVDPKATRHQRLQLLKDAEKEIRTQTSMYEYLKEKKRTLILSQLEYVKRLSALSGMSGVEIKHKLRDICQKTKIKEKKTKFTPFFSQLLQSRAALLQNEMEQPPSQTPFTFTSPSEPQPKQLQSLLHSWSLPRSQLQTLLQSENQTQSELQSQTLLQSEKQALSPAQQGLLGQLKYLTARIPSLVGVDLDKPHPPSTSSPVQVDLTAASPEEKKQHRRRTAVIAPSIQPQPPLALVTPLVPLALPLIRSKTGRLILPSYIKPNCPGYFALRVVDAKEEEGVKRTSSAAKPANVDIENQQKTVSTSTLPSASKSSSVSDQDKHTSTNSDPKPGTGGPATYLHFIPANEIHTSETCTNPAEVHCDTVAPPEDNKAPIELLGGDETWKDVSVSLPDEGNQNESLTLKEAAQSSPAMASEAADIPVPVKRGRGRPPKKKPSTPPEQRAPAKKRDPSKPDRDSLVQLSYHHRRQVTKSPDTPAGDSTSRASRPLTRGAMGKDFPSAKKRSWIEFEKELDLESD